MKIHLAMGAAALVLTTFSAAASDDFTPCTDAGQDQYLAGSLCARFWAPAEQGKPDAGKVSLFLRQFPAAGRSRGQVWLVTGRSGSPLYPLIGTLRQAFPDYDLIIPDRRGSGRSTAHGRQAVSAGTAARDLQTEIDTYAGGGSTLLYGTSQGSEVILRALPLVRPRRIEAVILDSPAAPLSMSGPEEPEQALDLSAPLSRLDEPTLSDSPPRTLLLQGERDIPPRQLDRDTPLTTYTIDGASGFLMLTVPECAAPLVRDFVNGVAVNEPSCAAHLTIRF